MDLTGIVMGVSQNNRKFIGQECAEAQLDDILAGRDAKYAHECQTLYRMAEPYLSEEVRLGDEGELHQEQHRLVFVAMAVVLCNGARVLPSRIFSGYGERGEKGCFDSVFQTLQDPAEVAKISEMFSLIKPDSILSAVHRVQEMKVLCDSGLLKNPYDVQEPLAE